jgi:hypothetical protein
MIRPLLPVKKQMSSHKEDVGHGRHFHGTTHQSKLLTRHIDTRDVIKKRMSRSCTYNVPSLPTSWTGSYLQR